jgi:hypothetical protein
MNDPLSCQGRSTRKRYRKTVPTTPEISTACVKEPMIVFRCMKRFSKKSIWNRIRKAKTYRKVAK